MTKVSFESVTAGDEDIYVDITVEGGKSDLVETVAIHTRDEAVRAIQAMDSGELPEDCDGCPIGVAWEQKLGLEEDDD